MLEVYLINLEGSAARLASATTALQAAGLGFQREAAFDGRGKRPEDLPLYDAARAQAVFGRLLTGGEVGCFLSHLAAARRFLAGPADYALVLEDDVAVVPGAAVALRHLLQPDAGGAWWVANLGEPARHWVSVLRHLGGGHDLVRAHYFPVTTTALLWNRAGAAAFVRDAGVIDMPVDHWLRAWATQARLGLAVNPPLFPATGMDSEIDADVGRKQAPRGWRYGLAKQRRMWRNKWRARAAQRAYQRAKGR